MPPAREFSAEGAKKTGASLRVDWQIVRLEEFRVGLEPGGQDPQINGTHGDEISTGKIALAHGRAQPDCYTRRDQLEMAAEAPCPKRLWTDLPAPGTSTLPCSV